MIPMSVIVTLQCSTHIIHGQEIIALICGTDHQGNQVKCYS